LRLVVDGIIGKGVDLKFEATKIVPTLSAVFLAASLLFAYGVAVGKFQVWPWAMLEQAKDVFDSYRKYGRLVPASNVFSKAPKDAARASFHVHQADSVMAGQYVFVGWSDQEDRFAAWLYDSRGTRLHTWLWDYDELDLDDHGPRNGSTMPHGFLVLPDGSALVNFDKGDVMARIDSCGSPVWRKAGIYHHSIDLADDGTAWTWRGGGNATWGPYNYLVNFDPNSGEILREVGLVEDIIKSDSKIATLFSVRADQGFASGDGDNNFMNKYDFFHPNDLEPLSAAMADSFPLFEAGDLMMSFRNLSLVLVMDANLSEIKWQRRGPWQKQHDPDFRADGKISIYDNNTPIGRSEILVVDPEAGVVDNELDEGNVVFFSGAMGKHQYLPNGNILVTVPAEGRIIEIDPRGNKVLEFNNLVPGLAHLNAHVQNGIWLPADYFAITPGCPSQ
jgi:hypothetical protein